MRRRHLPQILDQLAEKPGMGDEFWYKQKTESERRMGIIDDAPKEWRDLVNGYSQDAVAALAEKGYGAREAATILRQRYGRPLT